MCIKNVDAFLLRHTYLHPGIGHDPSSRILYPWRVVFFLGQDLPVIGTCVSSGLIGWSCRGGQQGTKGFDIFLGRFSMIDAATMFDRVSFMAGDMVAVDDDILVESKRTKDRMDLTDTKCKSWCCTPTSVLSQTQFNLFTSLRELLDSGFVCGIYIWYEVFRRKTKTWQTFSTFLTRFVEKRRWRWHTS